MPSRPQPVSAGAILLALFSLVSHPLALLPGAKEVPAAVIYGGFVLSTVGLIAAAGLWMLKKWGFWLTVVVSVLNFLLAAPGLVLALGPVLKTITLVGVVVPGLIIVLVVLPDSRRALQLPEFWRSP
jgi:uncharacterized membrane protein (DUF2068 family)